MKENTFYLSENARQYPSKVAFCGASWEMTYRQAFVRVEAMADFLTAQDLSPGDKIAILSQNSLNVILLMLTAQRLGLCVVPLNIRLGYGDWSRQLKLANCEFLFTSSLFLSEAERLSVPVLEIEEICHGIAGDEDIDASVSEIEFERDYAVVFTTGSRGTPKGVVLTNANIYSSARSSNKLTELVGSDLWMLSLPLYHVGGLGVLFRCLQVGATVYVPNGFSAEEILQTVQSHPITHLSVVPTMLDEMIELLGAEVFPSHVKMMLLGGAAASEELHVAAKRVEAPVFACYGMTELSSTASCATAGDAEEKLASVGKPLPEVAIRIENDEGEEAAALEEGRVLVKGDNVFSAYLLPEVGVKKRTEEWFNTGDRGYLDADGYLFVVGRSDDVFISGGENISASEIERTAGSFAGVKTAAVIAIDDAKWGQRPVLFVEVDKGFEAASLHAFLVEKLPKMKQPDHIVALTDLPRQGIGKVDYKKLHINWVTGQYVA